MKGLKMKPLRKLLGFIIPPGSDIRVRAFNILATCGIIVSIVTAFYNLSVGFGLASFFECLSGVFISLGLMLYTRKTGNYRLAMIITVLVIFIGLFTFLYYSNGGYYGGVPFFFVFAVVFTAFLLDGVTMPILIVIELVWYAIICIYSYYHPLPSFLISNEKVRVMDVIVCESIVSVSLAITMFFQIRVYRKKEQELGDAILVAKEASRAKSDFLAKMSHDIRTPLNTIMAMNEMIVSNTSSARIRGWVNDSNVSGRILLSLIDDMLDLTKIEAGRMELLSEPWDTNILFSETARLWKVQADKAGLEFEYDLSDEVPGVLLGDEDVIRKVTNNLLSNAIKYTKSGKVSLFVRWDDVLEIIVKDTGIGIDPDYLENIFNPFERGVQDIYRETSGSGLGLAIVKELVDAMEGTIRCDSVINEGTDFTIRLPLKQYRGDRVDKNRPEDAESAPETTKRFIAPDVRILVVDDNAINRKVIEVFLEQALVQMDEVESGFEALEMIDIKDYDLVFMDLRMPKMDGAETLERIHEDYPDFKAPVVVLTADIMNGVEERLLKKGFSGFLAKPVSSQQLYDTIKRFVPDKVISLETDEEDDLTLAEIENYQDLLIPYGVDLKLALENNAGNVSEFMTRAELFEQYADDGSKKLEDSVFDDDYYIFVHSTKSVAWGVGASLLARLSESVERRKDEDFSRLTNPVLIEEYARVRHGLLKLREEAEQKNEP